MTPAPSGTTKEALLNAAGGLLAEVGYAEMTTAAVARRAGVAEGTIYRHFSSKEALAEAVFERAWDLLVTYMDAHLPPRQEAEARLRTFLAISMDAFLTHPLDAAICTQEHMYWVALRGVSELPPGPERFIGLLEEAIRLAQAAGVARPDLDARLIAHMLFHGVGHVKQRFLLPGPGGSAPAYTPETFIAALDAFLEKALFLEPR